MRRSILLLLPLFCLTAGLLADSAAGLRWTAPPGWKTAAAQPMRAATYTVPPAAGDPASAECGVYFFGVGQGGSVEANLDRWKGQFQAPGGKPAAARIARRTAGGLTITTIDTAGEYSGLGGPVSGTPRVVSGYRLLGAIVEGPGGNVFVKFTGPGKTIAANQQKFDQLLTSFQRDK
ncbi:MAG: hypothetical protein ABI868_19215 [Acidobacteriota bacterium]